MKRIIPLVLLLLILSVSCQTGQKLSSPESIMPQEEEFVFVDWAGRLSFNPQSETVKAEVSVKSFVDGDTTHFSVPVTVSPDGVLKSRYIAINTPESTGKIEEWGKRASLFTKEKLSQACSIIIESDNGSWNLDSTGSRYLVWVWYKTEVDGEYRCLNLELLQEGLALPSSSANNRYGTWCQSAIMDAQKSKRCIWSGEKDPDFFYGDAVELTLKELRANIEEYDGIKVAFEGVVTRNWNNSVYIEDWDEESGCSFGIPVYYGFSLSGAGLNILSIGNRVRIVGTVQYYAGGDTYQVSGIKYREMRPDDMGNIQLLSSGHEGVWREITPSLFNHGTVEVIVGDEKKEIKLQDALLGTTVSISGLVVTDVYTTRNEDSSQKGAMTLTCTRDGEEIRVRTVVLYNEKNEMLEEKDFLGAEISVKGVVDTYEGESQIKVFRTEDITVE